MPIQGQADPVEAVERPPGWLAWIMALAIGATLTLLAVVLYYQTGSYSEANVPLRWSGSELRLTRGQGAASPDDPTALTIQAADAKGIVLWTPPRWINAGLYRELAWEITGLDARHPVRPIWQPADGQAQPAAQALPAAADPINLATEPGWTGTIATLGLFIPGPLASPMTVRQLELRPAALTAAAWWERLWEEWTTRQDWSPRSINFAAGATVRPLGSLTLLAAIWVGLSSLLYAGWMLAAGQRLRPAPFVALFLLAWLLLDMRWQWELSGRLDHTVERFAGKNATEQRLADLDGDLYRFVLEVRRHLPERPARLLIVSADPGGFLAGRARYHLLPQNDYMIFLQPPNSARAGDYILVLEPLREVRFDPA
ncbi:MAG: hypothetical protein KDI50_03320, partial [Candidatus Competibacteraceae bacterium]|nr:hypothetical protein [Candidatus Competibacteraceae bacterium]